MGLLIKGITKISELEIDADKDWRDPTLAPHGITNIKQVASAMSRGDIVVRGDTVLVRLAAGPDGYVLTSAGYGKIPTWAPAGGALKYYFPVYIGLAAAATVIVPDHAKNINEPIDTDLRHATGDDPANYIKRVEADLDSAVGAAVTVPDQIHNTDIPFTRAALSILCDGFVEETAAAVQTDHTAEAREGTANDLNLNPMSDTVLDKIYVGSNYPFWSIFTNLGQVGSGNWTNVWYYWNGAWVPVVDELDGSNEWQHGPAGMKLMTHTPQGDWVLNNIMGMNLYWLMSRTDNFVNRVIKPLGTQIWVGLV